MNPATVKAHRALIAAAQAKRAALAGGPNTPAEQQEQLTRWCNAKAAQAAPFFAHHVGGLAFGGGSLDAAFVVTGPNGTTVDLAPLLAGLFGPAGLADLLARHIVPGGVTAGERAPRLADLDAEILALEQAEEDAIVAAAAAGISIARRGDADPRAVLGMPEPTRAPPDAAAKSKGRK